MSNGRTSLYRPEEGRWLAGVAAGLGLRLGTPVWIVRIAFVLLCFAGGLGLLLYVAGWLLIPGEGETDSIIQGWLGAGSARRWVGVILVGIAALILAAQTRLVDEEMVFAVVLIGIGVMLYRGDLGRERRQDGRSADGAGEPPPDRVAPPAAEDGPPVGGSRPEAPVQVPETPSEKSFLGRVFAGLAVTALGLLGLFDAVIAGFDPRFVHYAALLVAVTGLGLVAGAWLGRSIGLIVLGVVLVPVLLLAAHADRSSFDWVSIESEFRMTEQAERVHYRPASVDGVLDEYELAVGSLIIDLTDVDFDDRSVTTRAEVGFGEVLVRLPAGVSATVTGEVGMGELWVGDQEHRGVGIEGVYRLDGSEGTLVLDAEVGMGNVIVENFGREERR